MVREFDVNVTPDAAAMVVRYCADVISVSCFNGTPSTSSCDAWDDASDCADACDDTSDCADASIASTCVCVSSASCCLDAAAVRNLNEKRDRGDLDAVCMSADVDDDDAAVCVAATCVGVMERDASSPLAISISWCLGVPVLVSYVTVISASSDVRIRLSGGDDGS